MKNTNAPKKLVIIAGVTGSIGQELLRYYLLEKDTLVYGISRRGVSLDLFDTLPTHNLIVNVNMIDQESIAAFIKKLPEGFNRITYYHLLGEFKTEINKDLQVVVENDHDRDGIDDGIYNLVARAYKTMAGFLNQISTTNKIELNIVSFGSLADRHKIPCFQSFAKSREVVKEFSRELLKSNENLNMYLLDTSTILAADEMLERPFIFGTDVNPVYWITPSELTTRTLGFIALEKGLVEKDVFIANPNFSDDYFDADITYKRRVKELFNINL